MLVRLLPVRGGTPCRFAFKNLWLEERKPQSIKFGGVFRAASEAQLEVMGDEVMLRPRKGEVTLNGRLVDGPRPLAQGDLIGLRDKDMLYGDVLLPEGEPYPKGVQAIYEFQRDLHLAKMARWDREGPRGIHRDRPDMTSELAIALAGSIVVDEAGLTLLEEKWGNITKRTIPWDELDCIQFEVTPDSTEWGDDALAAVGHGVDVGSKVADYTIADHQASDAELTLHAPSYLIRFEGRGKALSHLGASRDSCYWIARAIEFYAPIDLVSIGAPISPYRSPIESRTPVAGVR